MVFCFMPGAAQNSSLDWVGCTGIPFTTDTVESKIFVGIFYGFLVCFFHFGMLYQEKSGNPVQETKNVKVDKEDNTKKARIKLYTFRDNIVESAAI
jgi:hypothetical protein